jgi:hypothetical protein
MEALLGPFRGVGIGSVASLAYLRGARPFGERTRAKLDMYCITAGRLHQDGHQHGRRRRRRQNCKGCRGRRRRVHMTFRSDGPLCRCGNRGFTCTVRRPRFWSSFSRSTAKTRTDDRGRQEWRRLLSDRIGQLVRAMSDTASRHGLAYVCGNRSLESSARGDVVEA